MNNVENTLWVGFIFLVGILSLYFLFNDLGGAGLNLDQESSNMVTEFGVVYINTTQKSELFNTSLTNSGLPDLDVAPETKESAEAKSSITSLTSMWNIFVVFPATLIATMPFLEADTSLYLTLIFEAFAVIVTIMQLISLYKAWRGGNTNN